jgi:hypothetical protein
VRVLDGVSGCHLGIDTINDFEDRVAMPGISIKRTAYLVGKTGSFGHDCSSECQVPRLK